jgi:hypothetical protein
MKDGLHVGRKDGRIEGEKLRRKVGLSVGEVDGLIEG